MKRTLDLVIAVPLLVVLSPVIMVLAAAVIGTSPGPAFHRSTRVGRDGRTFTLVKLRSMGMREGPRITRLDDDRVTTLGSRLRRWRLDELPQLWNVVRGDMSLVGPRPEDPRFTALYTSEQRRVLDVRPGITGPAQLAFRDEGTLLDPHDPEGSYIRDVLPRKLAIDLEYVRRRSLRGDIVLIVRTLSLVLRRS